MGEARAAIETLVQSLEDLAKEHSFLAVYPMFLEQVASKLEGWQCDSDAFWEGCQQALALPVTPPVREVTWRGAVPAPKAG